MLLCPDGEVSLTKFAPTGSQRLKQHQGGIPIVGLIPRNLALVVVTLFGCLETVDPFRELGGHFIQVVNPVRAQGGCIADELTPDGGGES